MIVHSNHCFSFSAEGFINGLAAVTQDALELSSSDVFILCVVYDAKGSSKGKAIDTSPTGPTARLLQSRLTKFDSVRLDQLQNSNSMTHAWKGGKDGMTKSKLRTIFDQHDLDGSGYLEREEVVSAMIISGIITSKVKATSFIYTFREFVLNSIRCAHHIKGFYRFVNYVDRSRRGWAD